MLRLSGHKVSVVIADDHAVVRMHVKRLLQDCGLQVIGEAANGKEAVRQCEHLRPDVAVLDISMPVLNGFDAAKQIAILCPTTKIIFLTGHGVEEFAAEAFRAGGVAFVCKNHIALGLVAAIEAVMDGKTYISRKSAA